MRTVLSRYALSMGTAAALLVGCSASAPPIGPFDGAPQSRTVERHGGRDGSWMVAAKGGNLIYASQAKLDTVSVYSLPGGGEVGQLSVQRPAGLCSDSTGNVYVPSSSVTYGTPSLIYEYAHGGTTPIATFSDDGTANGCAVDSKTGDLAVTNFAGPSGGNVAVFQNATEAPKTYGFSDFSTFLFCAYDDRGNLYATGLSNQGYFGLFQLPKGGSALRELKLSNTIPAVSLQWVEGRLIAAVPPSRKGDTLLYPVQVSGDRGQVGTAISLLQSYHGCCYSANQFWIQGGSIIGSGYAHHPRSSAILQWSFPHGGLPAKRIRSTAKTPFDGITVSVAPKR